MILLTQHEFSGASGDPIHQEFQGDLYRALREAARFRGSAPKTRFRAIRVGDGRRR